MIKQQYKIEKILLVSLFSIALYFIVKSLVSELYIGYILLTSSGLNEIVIRITNIPILNDLYIVSLVKSFSDVNISLFKFIEALEFNHVVGPMLLLLVYDINRVIFKSKSLKIGVITYYVLLVSKYIILLSIALFVSPFLINPKLLFSIIGFLLIILEFILMISLALIFYSVVKISMRKEALC